jgi:N-terminal domain on NACHT_NTPase and P-loop NTPases
MSGQLLKWSIGKNFQDRVSSDSILACSKMPAGAENRLVVLVTDAIETLDLTIAMGNMKDAGDLPKVFREVTKWLPLVGHILEAVEGTVKEGKLDDRLNLNAMERTLKSCNKAAANLEKLYQTVTQAPHDSKRGRYYEHVRRLGKGKEAESLVKEMLQHAQILARNPAINPTPKKAEDLPAAITEVSKIKPSVPKHIFERPSHIINIANYGPGIQNVITGNGTQNNRVGNGNYYYAKTQFFR